MWVLSGSIAQPAAAGTIQFAGLTWNVKVGGPAGPGPNLWSDSPESVFVDAQGRLHLKIRQIGGVWHSAEVSTQQSFGHADYLFNIDSNADLFDRNVVVGLFTFLDCDNEVDIEFSRWGVPSNIAGQYVTQPAVAGNINRFDLAPAGAVSTHSFTWRASSIFFQSYQGQHASLPAAPGQLVHDWLYTGPDIPIPSTERLHINLWQVGGNPPSDGQEVELIVSNVIVTPIGACTTDQECDDGLFCTGPETCVANTCQSAGNPCIAPGLSCNEAADRCDCSFATVTINDLNAFASCLSGPADASAVACWCSDRDADDDTDLEDFAWFQRDFFDVAPSVLLFDFEDGDQGWFSFGAGTVDSGLLPTGGSGGAGPQGRFHRANFGDPTMTFGFGDISPPGQDMSPFTGMSIDARLTSYDPLDPYMGNGIIEFGLSIGSAEWHSFHALTPDYLTLVVDFVDLVPDGIFATQPITAAQLANPSLAIKMVMRRAGNGGKVELDYDQLRGLP
ncbi:MAG: hypothetical protein ACE5GE_00260 [Phycisphaerae bacterium]